MFFTPLRQIDQMLISLKWEEGWAASVNPVFVAQSTRSIATLHPGGMLVYHRVTSNQMLISLKWEEGWAASVNPVFVAQSTRSIATLHPGGMLVYHRVTSNCMSPAPIYKPGWRVTKWSKFLAYGNNGTAWLEFWPQDLNFPVLWTWQLNLSKFHSIPTQSLFALTFLTWKRGSEQRTSNLGKK